LYMKLRALMIAFLLLCGRYIINSEQTSGITQIVMQLNAKYKTNLNVFINSEDFTLDFQLLETPAIQLQMTIKNFQEFSLHGNFSNNALIIVFIRFPPLDPAVAFHLQSLLRERHELHIVFISEEDPNIWQEDLYKFCFERGFINTLLIHQANETQLLYSYNPYPKIKTIKLPQLKDYFNRWQILQNFHHFPIRTLQDTVEPRLIRYVNRKGEIVRAGYLMTAIKDFTHRYNATIEFLPILPEEKAFQTAFAMIAQKKFDIMAFIKETSWNMSNTEPLHLLHGYIAVPHSRPIASYLYFGRPFTWTLWLAVFATVIYGMVMLYFSYGSDRSELGRHLLSSLSHILFISYPRNNISYWEQFAIHYIMVLGGFVLTNLYLAMLSSMLTSGLFEPQLHTLQDLKHSPYPLLVDDYYIDYLKNLDSLPIEVKNSMLVGSKEHIFVARTGLNTSYMYFGYEDRLEAILYQQHLLKVPRFKIISESFMDGLMALPVARSLPYLNLLNAYLKRIFESGIWNKMKSDAWMDTIDSGIFKIMRNEGTEQKAFDLDFYLFAFGLWAIGLTLAGLCLLIELFRWRM
ncbi:hypothetical protein KR044_005102, partial [Drosophila immigrans]